MCNRLRLKDLFLIVPIMALFCCRAIISQMRRESKDIREKMKELKMKEMAEQPEERLRKRVCRP